MSIRYPRPILVSLAIAMIAHGAALADDTIATDRPDFVESSAVVGKGRLQVETSFALDRSSANGVRDTLRSTPTLVRFGITESIELRVESDGAMRQRSSDRGVTTSDHGYADASLGLKWHAMDARDHLPSVGVLLHADMSTGSAAFRDEGTRPSARVVAEWELPNAMSLGVMPGVGYERSSGGSDGGTVFGILGVVVGKAWNQNLRSFVEVSSARIARSHRGGSQASLTVGAAYLLTPTVQVDTAFSRGLNGRTPDLGLTVGLSFKL